MSHSYLPVTTSESGLGPVPTAGAARRANLLGLIAHVIVGAIAGIIVSLVVNSAMEEISISPFFAVIFGICFIVLGFSILHRIRSAESVDGGGDVADGTQSNPAVARKVASIFGMMVVASGVSCFFLERDWLLKSHWMVKIPLYTLLGTALSFSMVFSLVDMINQGFLTCQCLRRSSSPTTRPLVRSAMQIYCVLSAGMVSGAIFGFLFGSMDVEGDSGQPVFFRKFTVQEWICVPMGAFLGMCVGYVIWYLGPDGGATNVSAITVVDRVIAQSTRSAMNSKAAQVGIRALGAIHGVLSDASNSNVAAATRGDFESSTLFDDDDEYLAEGQFNGGHLSGSSGHNSGFDRLPSNIEDAMVGQRDVFRGMPPMANSSRS